MLIDTGIKINGTDITDYIAFSGVKWSRNDVDGSNAGRTLSGLMVRDRVATKIRLDITCRPLKLSELRTLLNLLLPVYVNVTYDDPMYGVVTKRMYANNNPAEFLMRKEYNPPQQWYICHSDPPPAEEYWYNVEFPLIER